MEIICRFIPVSLLIGFDSSIYISMKRMNILKCDRVIMRLVFIILYNYAVMDFSSS